MFIRMKRHLSDHGKKNAEGMYQGASNMVMTRLKKTTGNISRRLTVASKIGRDKLYKDLYQVIMSAGFGKDGSKPDAAKIQLQSTVMSELEALEKAWAKELENPAAQLRAANPFANAPLKTEDDMDEFDNGDGDDSGSDVADEDGMELEDSESEGDDE
jgi:hypothetical protein